MKSKKIGLIGNMNNNNFAILRYLIDLGLDAKLILMKNDGTGDSSHFSIAADTVDEEKWSKYIKQSNIYEHPVSAFNFPFSLVLFIFSLIRKLFVGGNLCFPVSKVSIRDAISDFDILIGSGIAPAMLLRVGTKLTVFYPYAIGVEYLEDFVFKQHLQSKNPIKKFFVNKLYKAQLAGIKDSRYVVNSDVGVTKTILDSHFIKQQHLGVPIIYNREQFKPDFNSKNFDEIGIDIKTRDFVLLSHVRHLWVKPDDLSDEQWKCQNKHNDWIIRGFSSFIKKQKCNAVLILFEYGNDVAHSKNLCLTLGLNKNILWLPRSPRKKILQFIDHIDVGLGEFYSGVEFLWGGSMLEFFSRGKPTIHGMHINKEKFELEFATEFPPLLKANSASDISDQLANLYEKKEETIKIGKASKLWFEDNYGSGLIKSWVALLK
jgi:hypothetical protein